MRPRSGMQRRDIVRVLMCAFTVASPQVGPLLHVSAHPRLRCGRGAGVRAERRQGFSRRSVKHVGDDGERLRTRGPSRRGGVAGVGFAQRETVASFRHASESGKHNEAVLTELGYSAAEIQGLRERMVI